MLATLAASKGTRLIQWVLQSNSIVVMLNEVPVWVLFVNLMGVSRRGRSLQHRSHMVHNTYTGPEINGHTVHCLAIESQPFRIHKAGFPLSIIAKNSALCIRKGSA